MESKKKATSSSHLISIVLLTIIFAIFAYFRFYNLDKRIIFDWDQQSFSNDIKNLIVDKNITLIGPRVTDDKGFFLGPYFTYLLAPFYIVSNLHPFGLLPFVVLVNISFFAATFFVIKKIWDTHIALLFLFLWSINPVLISLDIIPWWPIFVPLGVIGTWYILSRIYKNPSLKNFLLLGMISAFMTHMHFQFMFMIAFIIIFLVIFYRQNKPRYFIRNSFAYVGVILASLTPLLLFDIRHDFLNTNLFIKYFTERIGGTTSDIHVWRSVFGNFLLPITLKNNPFVVFGFYFGFIAILFFLFKKREKFLKTFYLASLFLWIVTYIGFSVYGRRPSEYYFHYLYPFIFIAILDFARYFKKEFIILIIALGLLYANISSLKLVMEKELFGLYYKDQAAKAILPYIKDKTYNVSYDMPLGANNGYDYILEANGINPSGNEKDPLIQLRIPPHDNDIKVKEIGVFIPNELK